jgi:hypothetical protein
MQWYYAKAGHRISPLPEAEFRALCAAGKIRPEDLIWTAGIAAWQPLGSVPGDRSCNPLSALYRTDVCVGSGPAEALTVQRSIGRSFYSDLSLCEESWYGNHRITEEAFELFEPNASALRKLV